MAQRQDDDVVRLELLENLLDEQAPMHVRGDIWCCQSGIGDVGPSAACY